MAFKKFNVWLLAQVAMFSASSLFAEGFIVGTKVWSCKNATTPVASDQNNSLNHCNVELVNIESLQPGDFCLSKNLETGDIEAVKIFAISNSVSPVMTLAVASLENLTNINDLISRTSTLTLALDHKFFVPEIVKQKLQISWSLASEIETGNLLVRATTAMALEKQFLLVVATEMGIQQQTTYCLSLEKNHNYFVTEEGIIVHNFIHLGIAFAFGGGEIAITGVTAGFAFLGLMCSGGLNKDINQPYDRNKESLSQEKDPSFKATGNISYPLDEKKPHSEKRNSPPRMTPPAASSGGGGGGPRPPKKDDDENKTTKNDQLEECKGKCDNSTCAEDRQDLQRQRDNSDARANNESVRANNAETRANTAEAKLNEKGFFDTNLGKAVGCAAGGATGGFFGKAGVDTYDYVVGSNKKENLKNTSHDQANSTSINNKENKDPETT
jgi:hypothetical protein